MNFRSRVRFYFYRPGAVLEITGDDAATFLQGQFTQDLSSAVDLPQNAAYGLWLNQKGRVLADSYVLRERGRPWLAISERCGSAELRGRLEAYVIADDVTVNDVTAGWSALTICGDEAAEFVQTKFGVLPPHGTFLRVGEVLVFRGRGPMRWEVLFPATSPSAAAAWSSECVEKMDTAEMERWRIENGICAVPQDVGPDDLPNEGGLEVEAISYTKGCYLGQEVMARLKNLGQVRRRIARVRGEGAPPARLPAPLFDRDKKLGELRSAVHTENGFVGLAMISLLGFDASAPLSFVQGAAGTVAVEPLT